MESRDGLSDLLLAITDANAECIVIPIKVTCSQTCFDSNPKGSRHETKLTQRLAVRGVNDGIEDVWVHGRVKTQGVVEFGSGVR